MSKSLIIVESPAKVKTIKKFLGSGYMVHASRGHVCDLPRTTLGVDEAHDFAPQYEIMEDKKNVVKELEKAASEADTVYLAPDPDREGEAIACHIARLLQKKNSHIKRIQFNEITSKAVKEALQHPRDLNTDLFNAQQARRVLDRLVGYKLSPLLWKKVRRGISAGRVQSVTLRLIVEREEARRSFTPEEYWIFQAYLQGGEEGIFRADLTKIQGKKAVISNQKEADSVLHILEPEDGSEPPVWIVRSLAHKERSRSPLPPFTTSTLQQTANQRLGYTSKRTMSIAQKLYEGLDLGERGTSALITYMRTDSVRIADEALSAAYDFIAERFGKDFTAPGGRRVFKGKASAQDAHEAIRPIDVRLTPSDVRPYLEDDQYRLYLLIWSRFVASQMADARYHDTTATIECGSTVWQSKGVQMIFPGFMKVMPGEECKALPILQEGERLTLNRLNREQKFTLPEPRFTEASLVRTLEELGIGRPSTYASIISTLQDRGYVTLEDRHFIPTDLGSVVCTFLREHFKKLINVGFTAEMETALDEVAEGKKNWVELLRSFNTEFSDTLNSSRNVPNAGTLATDINCPECGKALVIKFGKTGPFAACSGYPECRFTSDFIRDDHGKIVLTSSSNAEDIGVCPQCGKPLRIKFSKTGPFAACSGYPECRFTSGIRKNEAGDMELELQNQDKQILDDRVCPSCGKALMVRKSRTGSRFISCSGYPECHYAEPFSTGVPCPRPGCDGTVVEKSSHRGKIFYSCSNYPKCDFSLWAWPLPDPCPDCGFPVLTVKRTRSGSLKISCPDKKCRYTREMSEEEAEKTGVLLP
ncbi:MAG: type I DNA topoisomerase [Desulfovibrionaceae bacterium]|nr:type I DNA topoisomerase [Desulfovibrionaceae bacterium]